MNQKLGTIETNFEDVKADLAEQMKIYEELKVTESNKAERRKDVATLRKMSKAVSDKRIEVKNEYMKPYEAFAEKAAELVEIINKPIGTLNGQVKEFEEKQRLEKKAEIKRIYEESIGELVDFVSLEKIYDNKWENVATSLKSVKKDIEDKINEINCNVNTIQGMGSEKENEALDMYYETLDISKAINFISRYEQQKREIEQRMAEQQKIDREREIERERERVREEERARIREEERIREVERQKALEEQERARQAEQEAMVIQKLSNISDMVIASYKVQGVPEELEQIEMYMHSIGVDFERIDRIA